MSADSATVKRLNDAITLWRKANSDCALYGLYALCEDIRDQFPTAATITFDWTDQGNADYLVVTEVWDTSHEPLDYKDEQSYATNLDEASETTWILFTDPDSPDIDIDIDRVLAHKEGK